MSWMSTLYQTYESNEHMAGKPLDGVPLAPVAHMNANAQIEIIINQNGEFKSASRIERENAKTIIPVTEASASRTSGIEPHALCDMLSYIAGDFGQYLSDEKAIKNTAVKFAKYSVALKKWSESKNTHIKVQAVYAYISKQQITKDLILSGILETDENKKLLDKKVSGADYEKALVRFRVMDSLPDAVWQDDSLLNDYILYHDSIQRGKKDVCYITGEIGTTSISHPKGIIAAKYGAKLISSNDTSDFTFRGRFIYAEEACTISYESTQKAHSALTWLASRQGVMAGTQDKRTYICWNPNGKKVIDLEDPFGLEDESELSSFTEEEYKKRLIKTLIGYRNELDNNDDIVVMGLDAATTGRLSITYYNELKSSDFYDRLTYWGKTFYWHFTKFTPERKIYTTLLTPLTKQVVLCAFGTERGTFLEVNDKLMKEQSQRILHCMLDRDPLPRDIMHSAYQRASTPLAYSYGNRERILSTACALITKYYNDRAKGVIINMALDYENVDRSYLYGRLLAVLEKAERITFTSNEKQREPNAIRLQSAYVNRPMRTWKILEDKLNPYFQRMKPESRKYYKDLISEITDKLMACHSDMLGRPLDELYLIGYYLQRLDLNQYKNMEENNNGSV